MNIEFRMPTVYHTQVLVVEKDKSGNITKAPHVTTKYTRGKDAIIKATDSNAIDMEYVKKSAWIKIDGVYYRVKDLQYNTDVGICYVSVEKKDDTSVFGVSSEVVIEKKMPNLAKRLEEATNLYKIQQIDKDENAKFIYEALNIDKTRVDKDTLIAKLKALLGANSSSISASNIDSYWPASIDYSKACFCDSKCDKPTCKGE